MDLVFRLFYLLECIGIVLVYWYNSGKPSPLKANKMLCGVLLVLELLGLFVLNIFSALNGFWHWAALVYLICGFITRYIDVLYDGTYPDESRSAKEYDIYTGLVYAFLEAWLFWVVGIFDF